MAYRKLLVPLTGAARDNHVLKAAFEIAKAFAAHVAGLFVRPNVNEVIPYLGEGVSAGVMQEVVDAARNAANRSAAAARGALDQLALSHGVSVLDAPAGAGFSASFGLRDGPREIVVAEEARLADLVAFILPQDADNSGLRAVIESTLLNGRRAMLLVPQNPPPIAGRKIVIAWDGGPGAASAVAAAIPLLKRAEAIEILNLAKGPIETRKMDRLRDYLRLHGLSATEHGINPGSQDTGSALLDTAVRAEAGLLVMGGYGHSRLREMVMGGVTRHVLTHATLPVFMAH